VESYIKESPNRSQSTIKCIELLDDFPLNDGKTSKSKLVWNGRCSPKSPSGKPFHMKVIELLEGFELSYQIYKITILPLFARIFAQLCALVWSWLLLEVWIKSDSPDTGGNAGSMSMEEVLKARGRHWKVGQEGENLNNTLNNTNIAPESRPSQKQRILSQPPFFR